MTRGLRNNNPGNIRISKTIYLGEVQPSQDKAFKQFTKMEWGYRAMFVLLFTYHKNGYQTIRKMINRYAPPIDNNTENYVRLVAEWSGILPDKILLPTDPTQMIPVVYAMSRGENGTPAIEADVRAGWDLFMKHKP